MCDGNTTGLFALFVCYNVIVYRAIAIQAAARVILTLMRLKTKCLRYLRNIPNLQLILRGLLV